MRVFLALFAVVTLVAPAAAADGRRFALLVGVQKYDGTELTSLRYAERDVGALAELLRGAGYGHVVLLTDREAFAKQNEELFPTAANIRRQLAALLKLCEPADTVLVAFAGHGVQLRQPAGLFFCPKGAELTRPETLVPLDAVYAQLKDCAAGSRLLVVDACRNDPFASRSGRPSVEVESVTRPEVPKPPRGVAALFSCSAGERAFEDERAEHGFFFHALLEGMRGKAADERGEVDLLTLAKHVQREVPLAVQRRFQSPNAVQKPDLMAEGQNLVLVSAGAAAPAKFTNSLGMTLVRIREGTAEVGSPDTEARRAPDEVRRSVRIPRPFYLAATPVTQGEYYKLIGRNPSWFSAAGVGVAATFLNAPFTPVESVSYLDAAAFCDKLSEQPAEKAARRRYRLPTEDEWEYAARAGTRTAYPWGDSPRDLGAHAWYDGNSGERTQSVGGKPANAWGLYDMHGNVWQWCAAEPGAAQHFVRGGAWDAVAADCRSARRRGHPADTRTSNIGFRVLCEIGP